MRRMSQRLSVASSMLNANEKRESPNENEENVQNELERCEKIKTKYPEVVKLYISVSYSNIIT